MKTLTDRQVEIVDKSIEIISSQGIQRFTIKNLSKEIGITEPAIYRHFESKMAILLAILDKFEHFIKSGKELFFNENQNSLEMLEKIFKNYFTYFQEHPTFASVIFSEEIFRDDKRLSRKVLSLININFELIKKIILNGQEKSIIRKDIYVEQMVNIIMGSLRLLVKKWRISNFSFDIYTEGLKLFHSIKVLITENINTDLNKK